VEDPALGVHRFKDQCRYESSVFFFKGLLEGSQEIHVLVKHFLQLWNEHLSGRRLRRFFENGRFILAAAIRAAIRTAKYETAPPSVVSIPVATVIVTVTVTAAATARSTSTHGVQEVAVAVLVDRDYCDQQGKYLQRRGFRKRFLCTDCTAGVHHS